MAHNGESVAWNPALRPDDNNDLAATSHNAEVTPKDPTTEVTPDAPVAPEIVETLVEPTVSELDPSIDLPDTIIPDTTDSNNFPPVFENSNLDESLENNGDEWAAQFNDGEPAQIAEEESVPQLDGVNEPQPEVEDVQAAFPQPAEEPFQTADQNPNPFADDNSSPWPNEPENQEFPQNTNGDLDSEDRGFWENPSNDDAGDDFFDQLKTQTKPIYIPPETESRFEEGVPLLDDSVPPSAVQSPVEEPVKQQSQIDSIFAGDDEDQEEGAFFNEVQKSEPVEEQPQSLHITRKSTTQVLDSLDVPPYSPASDTSPTAQEFNNILAAAASENHAVPEDQAKSVSSDDDLAARWQAELSDDPVETEKAPEDDLAARWQAELDDDDDLLLGDEVDEKPAAVPSANHQGMNGVVPDAAPAGFGSPFAPPHQPTAPSVQPASYTPHQPSTSDLLQGIPPPPVGRAPSNYFAHQPQSSSPEVKAPSFAERSKEGYKSPYDLPDDLARPRRPAASYKPVVVPGSNAPPPARSSSMPMPPPSSALPTPSLGTSPSVTAAPPKNFYEELPLPPPMPRSRPPTAGRYTPEVNAAAAPPAHMPPPQANQYGNLSAALQQPGIVDTQHQLQSPERVEPYANMLAPAPPSTQGAPSAASRYSPKPPTLNAGARPAPSPRYSPAPPQSTAPPPPKNRYASQPSSGPEPSITLPFQPRTSSPLAYHEKVSYQPREGPARQPFMESEASYAFPEEVQPPSQEQEGTLPVHPPQPHDAVTSSPIKIASPERIPSIYQPVSPPRNPYAPPEYTNDGLKGPAPPVSSLSSSAPPAGDSPYAPPRRSQTQSPGQQLGGPRLSVPSIDPLQRPASVHGSGSPTKTASPYAPSQVSVHNRVSSQPLEFIPPEDGQQLDPLERWRGAPIVKFGFGGSITTCFPKHIPRYTAGQVAPKIKSSPGEVQIHQFNEWVPVPESIVQHPGPLKTKSKKKDLLAWLSSKVVAFENEGISEAAQLHPDSHKRHDEKILLWKIVKVLVEHDGNLEGSADTQKSLRNVIFPHLQNAESEQQNYGGGFPTFGNPQSMDATSRPDSIDTQSLESLRSSLLMGDREKAVWTAVDHRLWGHAMIVASTLDKSVWKQVAQEFVRREVRSATSNTEPIAALYEIFAGNIEESIDELVPPSARAGLQMVSKVEGQSTSKNALDGLNSWKETLGLVLSNRSPDDHQALLALGRLLLSYGRVEAAHICFIFSRAAVFGGADDPQTSVVLLGADHQHLPSNVLRDDDSILLTEAYEYATTVLAGSPTAAMPHLLAYKLIYAWSLAERGSKTEAQQYCDGIAAALKATTKPSAYHHQHLFFGVDELSARLRQTTHEGGSSWISKPSMEKVSGSMWAKFNSFVSGEDSDAASTGSGKAGDADVGPFAKLAGTPTVSRSPSMSDLYGPYASAAPSVPASGPSRYQPANPYAPNSSPEQLRGRSSLDSQRSSSYGYPAGRRGSQEPSTPVDNNLYQGGPFYNSPPVAGYQGTPPQTSHMPLAPVEEDSVSQSYSAPMQGSPMNVTPYQPTGNLPFGPSLTQPPTSEPEPSGTGYMPPSAGGGYEPPFLDNSTHLMPEPADDAQGEHTIQKKKSFMDDDEDDDIGARAAAVQKAEKERKDREADEAFRKAAEADAQKPAPAKKSWFGGWFGGKKDENIGGQAQGPGPIRAKLGEENSFYYDKDLKKWVNKKDPNSSTVTRGAPPPPKGPAPPSRTASGSSAPPPPTGTPGLDSRPSSSAGAPPPPSSTGSPAPPLLGVPPPLLGATARSVSTGAAVPTPPGSAMGLPPPPRPATSLSNASSIDDLLGAPQARKGGAAKGKKKGRYVDVMAK
ncbi:hypothetical protein P170DRAFT_436981 [Aspergillus steynii IBT 23096]|uniref:Protein transport protein sec16 n=1 Tax=Aspergillus steynii IBT 23096 TaxID=1392250 RepID=A0A2I2G946_9EURO|nr:uncharacterized protein P170DRAFT_436981 [Aspergillus steynii IBT 23096]PLB49400.1 hypothetical protein P170DRAFT_436981 [Aspergillus steynii IBT 23096]